MGNQNRDHRSIATGEVAREFNGANVNYESANTAYVWLRTSRRGGAHRLVRKVAFTRANRRGNTSFRLKKVFVSPEWTTNNRYRDQSGRLRTDC